MGSCRQLSRRSVDVNCLTWALHWDEGGGVPRGFQEDRLFHLEDTPRGDQDTRREEHITGDFLIVFVQVVRTMDTNKTLDAEAGVHSQGPRPPHRVDSRSRRRVGNTPLELQGITAGSGGEPTLCVAGEDRGFDEGRFLDNYLCLGLFAGDRDAFALALGEWTSKYFLAFAESAIFFSLKERKQQEVTPKLANT